MADTQSRLAEIYKAEKSKGGGIASTLGKRTLEKIDPRQFFNQKGFMAAALPSLFKSYSATPAKSGGKVSSLGSGSLSSGALETKLDILIGETKDVKINSKISAKNSMSLPDMARDMNVMRQNITTLVKQLGGETTNKADMYFKKSSENEAAYENKFIKERGVKTTPTQVGAKSEEKKGIFATIMEGLSSIFSMKGALIAGILAVLTLGIKEYFSNDEFKGKVDALVSDMFSTIKGFLIEYWKEVAIGLALLFPSATMTLISSGISILSNGITLLSKAVTTLAPLFAETLTFAVRSLITLLSGPAGLIILLGGALFAARKLFDQNQEEYLKLAKEKKEKGSLSEKDEARLKELNSPTNEAAAEKQLGYNPITGKVVTQQEANRSMDQRQKDSGASDGQLKRQAEDELMNEAIKAGKDPSKVISNKDIDTRFNELKKKRNAMNSAPNESGAEAARLAGKAPLVTPTPAAPTPTPTAPTSAPASKTPSANKTALDITASTEGGGRYDLAFGDAPQKDGTIVNVLGKSKNFPQLAGKIIMTPQDFSGKPLTEMTLAEVLAFQDYRNREAPNTNALGKYGFMRSTLFGNNGKSGLVGQLKLPMDTIFNAETQELLQATMRKGNAAALEKQGVSATDANLNLANMVGAGGVAKLLKPENADKNALDVLGLTGAAATTNPHLNKSSKDVIAATYSKYDDRGMAPGGISPSGTVVASASAPSSTPNLKMPSLAAAAPSMGNMIEAATSAFGDVARVFDTAMASVTNVTNNNTQSSSAGQQSQGNLPSVYDDVFLNLFQRVT